MLVRELTHEDRQDVASVFQRTFATAPWNENWSMNSAMAVVDEWLSQSQFFGLVAVDNGSMVGAIFGRFESWDTKTLFYVKELCVLPERQREGVGLELNRKLEENLRSRGVASVYLHTLRDSPASFFYRSQEYQLSEKMIMLSKKLE